MTKSTVPRRRIVAAAWAAPVVALAVAAPQAAASGVSRIAFTNVTATEGAERGRVYANTKVMVLDGPASVRNLSVTLTAGGWTETRVFPEISGWGVTPIIEAVIPSVGDTVVHFEAHADGVQQITGEVLVKAPSWWGVS